MNILFVTANFPPMYGGIANFNYHICTSLNDLKNNITVIANKEPNGEIFDSKQNFKIIRLKNSFRPTAVKTVLKILYISKKEKIDIVFFGHFGSTHWLSGVLAKKIFNIPYVILVHGTEFNAYFHRFTKIDSWVSAIVLKNANSIIVNSNVTKALVEKHGYKGAIHVVHPGIDLDHFQKNGNSRQLIDGLNIIGKKIILTVSRLVAKKNHENVLRALPEVINKIPNLMYLIIGDGLEENRLKQLVDELQLKEYVKFMGYIEHQDLTPYYHLCDVFIMPSKTIDHDYESFGIAFLEANACGKPVIAGRSGGIADAVIDQRTGLIVNPDDPDEIASTLLRLLTQESYAQLLGEQGRQRVLDGYMIQHVARNIENVLKDLYE